MRALWLAALAMLLPASARADLYVRSPIVEFHEIELEHNGFIGIDRKGSQFNTTQSYTTSIGYGVTPWWKLELEAETGTLPFANFAYQATTLENTFQLTPEGQYIANLGLFAEYSRSALPRLPSAVTLGPIIQTELNDFAGTDSLHTLNLFVSRDVGHNHSSDTGLIYAAQSKLRLTALFNPGIEAFGSVGNVTQAGRYGDQQHSVGPVVTGLYSLAPYGKLRYEIGYQFGLTSRTARGGMRWKFEYEIPF